MIVEHALLQVKPGLLSQFEEAMREAQPLIAASPGFGGMQVRRSAESEDLYLLTVSWSEIAAHRDGFRKSERYQRWRELLHHFYEPMPSVRYFGESIV